MEPPEKKRYSDSYTRESEIHKNVPISEDITFWENTKVDWNDLLTFDGITPADSGKSQEEILREEAKYIDEDPYFQHTIADDLIGSGGQSKLVKAKWRSKTDTEGKYKYIQVCVKIYRKEYGISELNTASLVDRFDHEKVIKSSCKPSGYCLYEASLLKGKKSRHLTKFLGWGLVSSEQDSKIFSSKDLNSGSNRLRFKHFMVCPLIQSSADGKSSQIRNLKDQIRDQTLMQKMDAKTTLKVLINIAKGIKYYQQDCEGGGLVHRDLKPANVMCAGFDETNREDTYLEIKKKKNEQCCYVLSFSHNITYFFSKF